MTFDKENAGCIENCSFAIENDECKQIVSLVMENSEKKIASLFKKWSGFNPEKIIPLPPSGSSRCYYRVISGKKSAIAVSYDQPDETKAFISFSRHFRRNGLSVPEIYFHTRDFKFYLLEDLGDRILFDVLQEFRLREGFSEKSMDLYRRVLTDLVQFQMVAGKSADFSVCFPVSHFDNQAYLWDLNYFKYNFLKLADVPFDEYKLEKDFSRLIEMLLTADHSFFVYRDFQARNIMIKDGRLVYIDYQGGRKGALHYDVASLLFQARAQIPFEKRIELVDYYISHAQKIDSASVRDFWQHFYRFALIRVLQTLGAYGYRGLYEKKQHFIESIPFALENAKWLIENNVLEDYPELKKCLQASVSGDYEKKWISPKLVLQINSFSYKRGIPADLSGNGGGFVFDCRGLPNPGRKKEYMQLTGKDQPVIEFLNQFDEVNQFIDHAYQLVVKTTEVYVRRGFTSLMVSFGCTGGRHRSVFCAERFSELFSQIPGLKIELRHLEQEKM